MTKWKKGGLGAIWTNDKANHTNVSEGMKGGGGELKCSNNVIVKKIDEKLASRQWIYPSMFSIEEFSAIILVLQICMFTIGTLFLVHNHLGPTLLDIPNYLVN